MGEIDEYAISALLLSYGRGVYVKYYSIAFAILPGVAGGLAWS